MNRLRHQACAGVWLVLAGVPAFAFYDRYWLWRDCFNELGRCYDPVSQQVFVEGAGFIWSSLTLLILALAVLAWWRAGRA